MGSFLPKIPTLNSNANRKLQQAFRFGHELGSSVESTVDDLHVQTLDCDQVFGRFSAIYILMPAVLRLLGWMIAAAWTMPAFHAYSEFSCGRCEPLARCRGITAWLGVCSLPDWETPFALVCGMDSTFLWSAFPAMMASREASAFFATALPKALSTGCATREKECTHWYNSHTMHNDTRLTELQVLWILDLHILLFVLQNS